jgi:hypothetical protein
VSPSISSSAGALACFAVTPAGVVRRRERDRDLVTVLELEAIASLPLRATTGGWRARR